MTDMVKRLRINADRYTGEQSWVPPFLREAADEIERLRRELKDALEYREAENKHWVGLSASDRACYEYPADTEMARAQREAFINGAVWTLEKPA